MRKQMLSALMFTHFLNVPVLAAEDIIGLRIQAFVNNPYQPRGDPADQGQTLRFSERILTACEYRH